MTRYVAFARDVETLAAQYGAPTAVHVERVGVTPEQALAHVGRRLLQPRPALAPPWWDELIGDFSLPAAEALEDVLPDIIRAALDVYLDDADLRATATATEAAMRRDTLAELAAIIADTTERGE